MTINMSHSILDSFLSTRLEKNAGCRAWLTEHPKMACGCIAACHVWCSARNGVFTIEHLKEDDRGNNESLWLVGENRVYCVTHMSILSQDARRNRNKIKKVQSFRSETKYHH
jgi:hypothetical protein